MRGWECRARGRVWVLRREELRDIYRLRRNSEETEDARKKRGYFIKRPLPWGWEDKTPTHVRSF